jgi:membrane-associated protein
MLTTALSLFLLCFSAGTLQPVPEDVTVAAAGFAAREQGVPVPVAFAAAYSAVLSRDGVFFGLGRLFGTGLFERAWVRRWAGDRLDRLRARIAAQGPTAVLAARMTVGARTMAFLVAGASGVSLRSFLVYDALGAAVTVPIGLTAGWYLGDDAARVVGAVVRQPAWLLVGVAIVAAAVWVGRRRAREPIAVVDAA